MQIHGDTLRFGVHAGQQDATFDDYLELWRTAEALGLDWASVYDHFQPLESDPDGPCFEAFSLLAAMAAHTERLRCGVIVTSVTYRNPAVLAKIAATIDHVSHGRMELGVGAGWHEAEHAEYGIDLPRIGARMDMLDDACHILRGLWTQERFTHAGKRLSVTNARAAPKPVQDRLPLWIGGSGEQRTLRIVAEHADGWNGFLWPADVYDHKLDVLARHCDAVGRDPADVRKQIIVRTVLRDTEAAARRAAPADTDGMVIGTPEALIDALGPMLERGVRDVLIRTRAPFDVETVAAFAGPVASALRA